jgi:hypothetical protein
VFRNAIVLSFALVTFMTSVARADEWDFVVAPYGLLPNISGDASIGRIEGADVDLSAGDVLNSLELGAMIQVEARHESGFGGYLNYAFMKLGSDAEGPLGFADFDADIFQGILEGYGTYRFNLEHGVLDGYAGVRWWDIGLDVDATTPIGSRSYSRDADWVDPVLGLRWIPEIADQWRLVLQGDVGGFGIASSFSWNVQAGVLYDYSKLVSVVLMYRALGVDYHDGAPGTRERFEYDTITQGPMFGVVFRL